MCRWSAARWPRLEPSPDPARGTLLRPAFRPLGTPTSADLSRPREPLLATDTYLLLVGLRSLINASAHLLPEAGARHERTLEAVRCSTWFVTDALHCNAS